MTHSLITIRNLNVALGGNHILKGLNADLMHHSITALIGLNGAGKSTLLRALVKGTGTVTLEFPHLQRLIERRQYDTIYHEHFSYLSLLTSSRALATAGLTVVDVDAVYARLSPRLGELSASVSGPPA